MKCPKCGYLRKAQDGQFVPENECPSCGVIFNKMKQTEYQPEYQRKGDSQPSELLNNPSPVSAASLQKARSRVDRRLREQQKALHRDSRHIRTLQLARRLSAEGVRKRQEAWEKQNDKKASSSTQEESDMNTQPSQQATSNNVPDTQAPRTTQKQASSTIAMALKKRKREPIEQSAPQTSLEQPTDTPGKKEQSVDMVDPSWPPNAPIRLSQDEPVGSEDDNRKPPTLKEMLKDFDPPDQNIAVVNKPHRHTNRWGRGGLAGLLPMVAWIILSTGVIGAILSWTTLANAQPGANASLSLSGNVLPAGLLIGFAYLATGMLGFAFFWVSSLFSRQLKDIERLLLLQSIPKDDFEEE